MNLVLDGFNSLPFSLSMFREEVVTQDSRMKEIEGPSHMGHNSPHGVKRAAVEDTRGCWGMRKRMKGMLLMELSGSGTDFVPSTLYGQDPLC